MVVMFTHKASGAWDALASGLVRAGFVITASWPVHGLTVVTRNVKDFEPFRVPLLDPFATRR